MRCPRLTGVDGVASRSGRQLERDGVQGDCDELHRTPTGRRRERPTRLRQTASWSASATQKRRSPQIRSARSSRSATRAATGVDAAARGAHGATLTAARAARRRRSSGPVWSTTSPSPWPDAGARDATAAGDAAGRRDTDAARCPPRAARSPIARASRRNDRRSSSMATGSTRAAPVASSISRTGCSCRSRQRPPALERAAIVAEIADTFLGLADRCREAEASAAPVLAAVEAIYRRSLALTIPAATLAAKPD